MAEKQIDWDEIEDAVREYGDINLDAGSGWNVPTRKEWEDRGLEATMVRIHNAVREGTEK